eukprot:CAMPEP_0184692870 /NCGR_PEP_ID=MMETSP0313-20130426/1203_1 /TAXON_ID=2792 /ORGANISM="Porphyridium aerugineum, Strain SAG 1380-2" /LENGTH=356 /DNA_ID=CAMNT_0027150767 /DNA_START=99 /DNA_END=1169 /DNA_ORIENTATION=-
MRFTKPVLSLWLQSGPSELLSCGRGGRSSVSGVVATVFGATGFLGRYVVNQLGMHGTQVITPWRGDGLNTRHLKLMGDLGQIVPMEFSLMEEESIRNAVKYSDVVVNMIGKHFETRNFPFKKAHVEGSEAIARISKECGVEQFVQMSTANASDKSLSPWVKSKYEAEQVVRQYYPDAVIIRPTDVFGHEDRLLNRICSTMFKYGFYPMAGEGNHFLQPVHSEDVAKVISAVIRDPEGFAGATLVLGGPNPVKMREIVDWAIEETRMVAMPIVTPEKLLPFVAKGLGLRLPLVQPEPIWSKDNAYIEISDNIVREESGVLTFKDLEIVPTDIFSDAGEEVLRAFRRGGDRSSLFYVE